MNFTIFFNSAPNKQLLNFSRLFLFTFFLFNTLNISAQESCACNIQEVKDNSVTPCDLSIGEVVTVSSVTELREAIALANSNGGNMTILIADGTYQVASTASFPYITGSNVVFRSLSGNREAVTIRGGGMMATGSTEDGFLIAGDNVTIADLTINEVGNHGIQVSGHNLVVHNVRIQNTYEQMLKGSTFADEINSAIIQCSLFEYTAGIGPNWYIGGIDVHKGNGWIVRDNIFKNIISPGGSIAEHAIHFWNQSRNNIIERNQIINCDRGIGFGLGQNGDQNDGGFIRNNMIYNEGIGEFNDVGIGLESSPNTEVYNNTVYVNYPNAIEYRFQTTTNVEIRNNLTNKAITSRNGGTATIGTNFTEAEDDWFMNLAEGDLQISGYIDEIVDRGDELNTVVTDDFNQIPRPQGLAYDIGAEEFLMTQTEDIEVKKDISIYPNPAQMSTELFCNSMVQNGQIKIFNLDGVLVKELKQVNGQFITLDLINITSGIYSIHLIEKDHPIRVARLIILP